MHKEIELDNKKYIIMPKEDYKTILKKASLNIETQKIYSFEEAKRRALSLVRKWAKEK